uniref:Small membrane A-kinase anchor protein n=1 Tax=Takifugu rubripes TaxID=31033 RepID=A0A3B5KM37_TAKRU
RGCAPSPVTFSAPNPKRNPDAPKGERARLVHPEEDPADGSPQADPVLLEYAQKLSEEIVVRAVQQWVEVDRRYCDIPYIECDVP